jgi:pimeloyl-ACP methyl ester carboxylesterase
MIARQLVVLSFWILAAFASKIHLSSLAEEWYERGETLEVPGTASTRIWRQGDGPPVVCLHGVPASSYLYRKVLPELASRGLEGVALDFPGMGFAERPKPDRFDYSWSGLSNYLEQALDAAEISQFHLVVHDIGGPIGFDLANRISDRILSMTVLDTIVNVASFKIPVIMRPFRRCLVGRAYIGLLKHLFIVPVFRKIGVLDSPTRKEIRVYGELLALGDQGSAFRSIMNGFENNEQFENTVLQVLGNRTFPAQVVWANADPVLSFQKEGAEAKTALALKQDIYLVDG